MSSGDSESLNDHTRRVWQPRAGRKLSDHDCREIERNIHGFLSVLAEWAEADRSQVVGDDQSATSTNTNQVHKEHQR